MKFPPLYLLMINPEEERDNPVIEREVTVSETLHKSVKVKTQNYVLKGVYMDEDFQAEYDCDFSDTNWLEEFGQEHHTLEGLLKAVPEFLEKIKPILLAGNKAQAEFLIKECQGWTRDEIEAVI